MKRSSIDGSIKVVFKGYQAQHNDAIYRTYKMYSPAVITGKPLIYGIYKGLH